MNLNIQGTPIDILQALPEIVLAIQFNQTKGETTNVKWEMK